MGIGQNSYFNLKGATSEFKGATSEFKGSTSELKGSTSELKGSTFELKGSTSEFKGATFELKGSTSEFKGATSEFRSSTSEIKGSSCPTSSPYFIQLERLECLKTYFHLAIATAFYIRLGLPSFSPLFVGLTLPPSLQPLAENYI
ncbi:MAG: hypothetical protein V7K90_24715 [Nostoc sp.]|uniref:hypothetical protein n=1 Tax=Nostoc sp. TaxID=1180 RepID=UPI002FF446A3